MENNLKIIDSLKILYDKKIVLYGAGRGGIYTFAVLKYSGLPVLYFCDSDLNKQGQCVYGIEIISPEQLKQVDNVSDNLVVIITAQKASDVLNIKSRIDQLYLKTSEIFASFSENVGIDGQSAVSFSGIGKQEISILRIPITDECNLKCKGCSHFSNLYTGESHYAYEQFKADLTKVAENCHVYHLQLLGGEPLMCKDLCQYLDIVRIIFPFSDISICTNGTLITKQADTLFENMRNNDVSFVITPYKPTVAHKDEIMAYLSVRKAQFKFQASADYIDGEAILKFSKFMSSGNSNPFKSMSICPASGNRCLVVRDGKLYKCQTESRIYKYLETFQIESDIKYGIDIYQIADWKQVLDKMNIHPVDTCRYCAEERELMDWEVSNHPGMNDWVVN